MFLSAIVTTDTGATDPYPSPKKAVFRARYQPEVPEDQSFQKATPNADATFCIDNPAVLAQLQPGKCYYFDISEVPAPATT
jgi:hypothetical protein